MQSNRTGISLAFTTAKCAPVELASYSSIISVDSGPCGSRFLTFSKLQINICISLYQWCGTHYHHASRPQWHWSAGFDLLDSTGKSAFRLGTIATLK